MADEGPKPDTPQEPPAPAPVPTEPPAPAPDNTKDDWRIIELGQTRRQLEERQTELQRVQDENRRMQQLLEASQRRDPPSYQSSAPPPTPIAQPQPEARPDNFNHEVQQEVSKRIRQERAQQLDVQLQSQFPEDYPKIIENLNNVQNSVNVLFEDIIATGEGAYVTATIGKDPREIQRLRDMPQAQRLAALVRIAIAKPKPTDTPAPAVARPSDAPPPPSPPPRGGVPGGALGVPSGAVDLYDKRFEWDNYKGDKAREMAIDDTWYAERKRQKLESTGRAWSLRK